MATKSPIDPELVRELAELLNQTDLTEIEVEKGDLRVRVARNISTTVQVPAAAPMVAMPAPVAAAVAAPVEAKPTEDGRLVLRFQDGAFKDPFIARYVSDGTIKMFAYLVLLYDPQPFPLLAVEEPENQLYPELLAELAEEFRAYAQRGGQVFISTHSPDFLNGLKLEEIYWLRKENGFTIIQRASDAELLSRLIDAGDLPGALWKQGLFEGVHN